MEDVIKPKSKVMTKDVRALTVDEQSKLTEYLQSVRIDEEKYKVCFLLQMYAGLRIGEVLALQKDDIDFENKLIRINKTITLDIDGNTKMNNRTKTFAGRRKVPIPPEIINELKEQVEIAKTNKDNLLFTCDNEYVRYNSVNAVLKRIFEKQLGLDSENISTHVLRHTYATRCIEAGMTPVVLQRLMGHTDVKVTLNTYTSVFNEFQEKELGKVSRYLQKTLKKDTLDREIEL